jgi:AcrR family transcriptional regulator
VTIDTPARLMEGAIAALRAQGIAGVSARTIAAAAGVNQALIFYHFGGVDDLLTTALLRSTELQLAQYRERLGQVESLRELLYFGRELQEQESVTGNLTVLAQMLAAAQTNPGYAKATGDALHLWSGEIETVLHRVLAGSPLAEVADVPGLARAVSASFIGMELMTPVDPEGDVLAFHAIDQLGALIEYLDALGPTARRALRVAVRRAVRGSSPAET